MIKTRIPPKIYLSSIVIGFILGFCLIASDALISRYAAESGLIGSFASAEASSLVSKIILLFLAMSFVLLIRILFVAETILTRKDSLRQDLMHLFNSMDFCVIVYTVEDEADRFVIREMNEIAEMEEKVAAADVVGRDVMEVFPGMEKFGLLNIFKRVWYSGIPEVHSISFYADDIRSGWRQNYVFKTGRDEIIAVYQDLSEKVEMVERLKKTETQIDSVMKTIPMFFLVADGEDRIKTAMGKSLAMLGFDANYLKDKNLGEVFSGTPKLLECVRKSRNGLDFSSGMKIGDRFFDIRFAPLLYPEKTGRDVVALGVDVSEKIAAEKEKNLLAAAIDQAAEIVMITDTAGKIEYVNPAFEKITGFMEEEVVGKNMGFIKSGQHDEDFYKGLWQELAKGNTWRGHFYNRKKDGSVYEEEAVISPVKDQNGSIVSYVAVKRDVTQEMALETQFRQSQKMEAVGRLAGGIAHDFNNILTAIIGYSDMALMAMGKEDPSRESIEEIRKSGRRAAALTKQLLAFTRKQVVNPKPISARDVVSELSEMIKRIIGESYQIDFSFTEKEDVILADPGQMHQVILNLLVNARDSMPEGGTIGVSIDRHLQEEDYCFMGFSAHKGDYVRISVSDHGCGMGDEVLSHLFEPFFTTKPKGKGTGLGLSTVYGIIKQHFGFITCESGMGKGTTMRVFLPFSQKGPVPETEHKPSASPKKKARKKILIAEDEKGVQALAAKVLQNSGFETVVADNGKMALDIFEQKASEIDCVLTDMVMPLMDGKKLVEHLTKIKPELRIVLMSGYPDVSLPVGHDGEQLPIILKPFSADQLTEVARKVFL